MHGVIVFLLLFLARRTIYVGHLNEQKVVESEGKSVPQLSCPLSFPHSEKQRECLANKLKASEATLRSSKPSSQALAGKQQADGVLSVLSFKECERYAGVQSRPCPYYQCLDGRRGRLQSGPSSPSASMRCSSTRPASAWETAAPTLSDRRSPLQDCVCWAHRLGGKDDKSSV